MMIKKILLVACCTATIFLPAATKKTVTSSQTEPLLEQSSVVSPVQTKSSLETSTDLSQTQLARVELSREQSTQRAIPLVLGLAGERSTSLNDLGKHLAYDLGYSGQCALSVRSFDTVQKKEVSQKLLKENILLAVFVQQMGKNSFEVRLYDTARAAMLFGKRFSFTHDDEHVWAHIIADALWPALTGQPGVFSTKIAYCKKVSSKKGAKTKHVYMCDYDGSNEERLVETPTINIAPRWNRDAKRPLVYYSAYTNNNVRLEAVNMRKQRAIVSSSDGITMVPAFSIDGKSVAYCASRGKGSCQLFMMQDKKVRQLTSNTANNVSPSFSHDGSTIYFCSDYETGLPQICTYKLSDGSVERITDGGYCAAPACSTHHNKVAYAKIIEGVMQILVYDPAKKTHTQVTFGPGQKEECSWSPCGTYLVYGHEEGAKGSIVSLNLQTNQRKTLTSARDVCSYPSWSPVYDRIPSIVKA
jgi:TolB protein